MRKGGGHRHVDRGPLTGEVGAEDATVLRVVDAHADDPGRAATPLDAAARAVPAWAVALDGLLESAARMVDDRARALASTLASGDGRLGPETVESLPSEGYGASAVAAFVPWARARLTSHPARPSPALERSLVAHLLRRLLSASLGCLRGGGDERFRDDEPPLAGWRETLRCAPSLGRVMGTIAAEWAVFADELLLRFAGDRAELARAFGEGDPPALAVDFTCDPVGDTHDHGRCVMRVSPLGSGSSFLYKPKDTRLTDALSELLQVLGADLLLPARLSRADYAWEQFVVAAPPTSEHGWARLSRDVGMWICLFGVLGSSDIHIENVVIAQDRLVPVDTETIVPFLLVDPADVPWAPAASSTALLTAPLLRRAEHTAMNFGLLAASSNAPLLDHVDDMVDGFVSMHRLLVDRRAEFAHAIESWSSFPARAIVRPSWVYALLLRDSLQPDVIASSARREAVLARLGNEHARSKLPAAVIDSEIGAVRDGEIPLFRMLVGERDVIGQDGRVAKDVLSEPALAGNLRRIEALPAEPDPADKDSLAALAFCAAPEHRADRDAVEVELATEPVQWTSHARQSMRELVGLLRRGGPAGAPLRAGIGYVPHNDAFALTVRRPADLLSGSAGLALTLASGGAGADAAFAAEVLREARVQAAELVDGGQKLVAAGRRWLDGHAEAPRWHPYWGLPAVLHALWTLPADVLAQTGADQVVVDADEMLADLDPGAVWEPHDLSAASGLLLALEGRARNGTPGSGNARRLADAGDRLAAHLAAGWEHHPRLSLRTSRFADTLPSVHGFAALALWRRATRTGAEPPSPVSSWRDAAKPEQSGDRLILLAMGVRPARLDGARAKPPTTSLEHLTQLEERLIAYREHADELALSRAEATARVIVGRRTQHGRWFPEGLAGDRFRLSAMWGLAAVVRNLQGLDAPGTTRSIRLLDPAPVDP